MNGEKHGGRSERIVYVTIVGLVLAGLSVTGTVIAAGHWRPQNVLPKEIHSSFHAFHLLGFYLGLSGMPRRYYNTLPEFEPLLRVAAIGAVLLCVSILVWVYFNAAEALRRPR